MLEAVSVGSIVDAFVGYHASPDGNGHAKAEVLELKEDGVITIKILEGNSIIGEIYDAKWDDHFKGYIDVK